MKYFRDTCRAASPLAAVPVTAVRNLGQYRNPAGRACPASTAWVTASLQRPRVLHKFPGGGGERCPRQARQPNRALGGRLQLQNLAPRAGRALLEHQLGHQRQSLPAGDHCDHALIIHDVASARHMQVVLFKVALDVGIHVGLLADERLAAQLLGPHHAGAARLVVGRRDADEPVIIERLKIQIVGAGVGEEPPAPPRRFSASP